MPLIHVSLIEGRSEEKIKNLIHNLTDTVAKTLDSPLPNIRVIVSEYPASHWGIEGKPASEVRKISNEK
ncbi:4-oxalocrotonate tautomerase [Brevibacillus daliensis]|uniref:4-oxalocrotonate tautomerase n=1 Tax=Brevibacillus daliensis TaxID=2892995 RepID=UPI001E4143D7